MIVIGSYWTDPQVEFGGGKRAGSDLLNDGYTIAEEESGEPALQPAVQNPMSTPISIQAVIPKSSIAPNSPEANVNIPPESLSKASAPADPITPAPSMPSAQEGANIQPEEAGCITPTSFDSVIPEPPDLTFSEQDLDILRLRAYTIPENFGHEPPTSSAVNCKIWNPPTNFLPPYFLDEPVFVGAASAKLDYEKAYDTTMDELNAHMRDKDDQISHTQIS